VEIKARIKTPFGEVVVIGKTAEEIIENLENFPDDFIETVSKLVSKKLSTTKELQLEGLIEFTTDGPLLTIARELTHYEAIGLVLYASEDRKDTSAHIGKLLKSSGIKSMVPARLNEMTKRGQVFKPDPNQPYYRLTAQGERWIEEEVLTKIKGKNV
jgi:hypothetical protein